MKWFLSEGTSDVFSTTSAEIKLAQVKSIFSRNQARMLSLYFLAYRLKIFFLFLWTWQWQYNFYSCIFYGHDKGPFEIVTNLFPVIFKNNALISRVCFVMSWPMYWSSRPCCNVLLGVCSSAFCVGLSVNDHAFQFVVWMTYQHKAGLTLSITTLSFFTIFLWWSTCRFCWWLGMGLCSLNSKVFLHRHFF